MATETLADLMEPLGNIPPERILVVPFPGTATEEDVLPGGFTLKLAELFGALKLE